MSEPRQETEQKPTSNPEPAERRNSLFACLGHLSNGLKHAIPQLMHLQG
ncbi:MAG: hypothetical protein ABR909_10610 [Candidatus Bathyarchaeia archaeon]